MKLLALSDTQIGAGPSLGHNRLADQEAILTQIADLATGHDVDLVLHCGDVFEHRHPSEEARMVFKRFSDRVRAERRLIVIAGNHDLSNADTASAVDVHGIDFVRRDTLIDIGDATLACLPWAPTSRLIAGLPTIPRAEVNAIAADLLLQAAQDLYDQAPDGKPVILALHWWLAGASTATGTTEAFISEPVLDVNALADIGFGAVLAGHVHKPQILHVQPPIVMCGPTSVCNYGEAETEHGVWLADTERLDALEFLPLRDRRFITVNVDLTEEVSEPGLGMPGVAYREPSVNPPSATGVQGALVRGFESHSPDPGSLTSLTQDSPNGRADSQSAERGHARLHADGELGDQGPGMRARIPGPEDSRAEDSRHASGENAESSQDPIGLSPASPALDETDVIAAAIIVAGGGELDGAILRVRYTASEEQHRRIDAAALRKACDDAGVHKLYAIEPTIIRAARARVEGFDRDLDEHSALAAWCQANEIPEGIDDALHDVLRESRATSRTTGAGAAFDPITLTGSNIGRFPDLHVPFEDGASVLLGGNGTGKSTILSALELALYADDAGDLREIIAPWADHLELELTFTLDGVEHRIRRALRGVKRSPTNVPTGGKATVDFERRTIDGWHPLTQETAKATQRSIVEAIGMSRALFRASCFLAQGDGPAFLTAEPKDRKAMAAELLDPAGLWASDAAFANGRAKAIDAEISATRARITGLEETAAQVPALEADLRIARDEHAIEAATLATAETTLEQALAEEAGNEAAAERAKAAVAERDTAQGAVDAARQKADNVMDETARIPYARELLDDLETKVATIPDLETRLEEQRAWHAEQRLVAERRSAAVDKAVRLKQACDRTREELAVEASTVHALIAERDRLTHAEDGHERCSVCEQVLGTEARQAAITSNRAAFDAATQRHVAKEDEFAIATREEQTAAAEFAALPQPEPLGPLEEIERPLEEARAAVGRVATGRDLIQRLEQLAGEVDGLFAVLRSASSVLAEKEASFASATKDVKDTVELAEATHRARQAVANAKGSTSTIAATVTRIEERLTGATTAAQEAHMLTQSITEQQAQLDLYRLAERVFGRHGIPVLLLETVLPQIDADANKILRQFPTSDGWTFQVRFETQREQASTDRLREELYVMVDAPDYPQDYRTLSGGEDSRVSFAVRVALAMLLGRLRGADSRLLVLDELPFLDETAEDTLVALVNELVQDGTFSKVLTVSHSPAVRDAFAQTIEIVKNDGRSAIAGAARELADVLTDGAA